VINVTTRSGTNEIHGSLTIPATAISSARSIRSRQSASLRQNDFGATLGGPISQDRTFLFATIGLRQRAADRHGQRPYAQPA